MSNLPLFDPPPAMTTTVDVDGAARAFAVDPRHNVVLEASAGTGKTTVLVHRYVNLLKAGVEPSNILAITFTRKAATEMRERIVRELRTAAARSEFDKARWVALRDRISEIAISTIDAFCLSLLREFPLEADLDPGFDMADETEVPRFIDESLDRSLRIFGAMAKEDPDIALVIAQLGVSRTRAGLASLLDRRLVAWEALDRFLTRGPKDLKADVVCRRAADGLLDILQHAPGGLAQFLADGPSLHPRYKLFLRQVQRLQASDGMTRRADPRPAGPHRAALPEAGRHGAEGQLRSIRTTRSTIRPPPHPNAIATRVNDMAPQVERVIRQFARELNAVLARGLRKMFAIALVQYRRTLEARSVLDFSDVLDRALMLLRRMDEFSQSRFRLESRYHHVLVDEFQDTSRAQWELVSLLIQSWGEGMGLASNPSIFIVGDRKQSIYRFRDAEVAVLTEAGRYIEALRPGGGARRSISRSFRAVPELLEFVNEVCGEMACRPRDPMRSPTPIRIVFPRRRLPPPIASAARCLGLRQPKPWRRAPPPWRSRSSASSRTRSCATRRPALPGRPGRGTLRSCSGRARVTASSSTSSRRGPFRPTSTRGSASSTPTKSRTPVRSSATSPRRLRICVRRRCCAPGSRGSPMPRLAALAPSIAAAITEGPPAGVVLDEEDARVLRHLQVQLPAWLALVDRIPPADLFEQALPDLAYAYEIRGPRRQQAWENLKKMRGLIRRIQNRGYATLSRIADHIDALSAGDESNAVLEAIDAVNLMTVHASKGLEFPVVFVVNMARGATGFPRPIKVIADGEGDEPSVSVAPFVSELDELEREREQHETRRLLYVATTRARDRLYLSSALKDGTLRPGPGSLADVLPASLKPLFAAAGATGDETVQWTSASGRTFTWRVCRPPSAPLEVTSTGAEVADVPSLPALTVSSRNIPRLSVTEWLDRRSARRTLRRRRLAAMRYWLGSSSIDSSRLSAVV